MHTFRRLASFAAVGAAVLLAASSVRPTLAVETVVVQPGDTLIGIASASGVSVEQLVSLNGLSDPDRILVGQVLRVVPDATAAAAAAATPRAADTADPGAHVVQPGENLTAIAAVYGTTIAELVEMNRLADPSLILAGQRLTVPPRDVPAAAGTWAEYVVRPGDHLTGIAAAHGTTVAALAEANAIVNPSVIWAGSVIRVPVRAAAAPAAPPPAASQAASVPAPQAPPAADETPADGVSPLPMPGWMAPIVAERDGVRRRIVAEAEAFGVPPAFALAVAWQESGFQQSVVSSSGAVGVMQLLPETGRWVAEAMLGEPVDVHDAASNIRAGVRLLRHYLDRYDGDKQLVLAAYFQGQYAADTYGVYGVTRPYIASILLHERFFAR